MNLEDKAVQAQLLNELEILAHAAIMLNAGLVQMGPMADRLDVDLIEQKLASDVERDRLVGLFFKSMIEAVRAGREFTKAMEVAIRVTHDKRVKQQ